MNPMKRVISTCFLLPLLVYSHSFDKDNLPVRCRTCGATVAYTRNYMVPSDVSAATGVTKIPEIHKDAKSFVYENPTSAEFQVVSFVKATGDVSNEYSHVGTFFPSYNWRHVLCSRCKKHLGWFYTHDKLEKCYEERHSNNQIEKSKDTPEMIVDNALDGQCMILDSGWWKQRLCYKDSIRQYHEEEDGSHPQDWSMGYYNKDATFMEQGDHKSNEHPEVVQIYNGGQHCDENGKLRATRVSYVCCPHDRKLGIHISKLDEPHLCSYHMIVCVPHLCPGGVKTFDEKSSETSKQRKEECRINWKKNKEKELGEFYGLIWSNVVTPLSQEMKWTHDLDFLTSISR